MDIPVLILAFNRPDVLQTLINRLREVKPSRIYLVVDGPRASHPDDAEKVSNVRNCISEIDWVCEKNFIFREENMGCRHGITNAIDWFFTRESRGIILEDDCIPAIGFFDYCRCLLDYYNDDKRVFSIAGYNPVNSIDFDSFPYDYWFYPTAIGWGWATWADRWKYYNDSPDLFKEVTNNHSLLQQTDNSWFGTKYQYLIEKVLDNKITAWDYVWSYTHLLQSGHTIIPKHNYIDNIGYNHPDASHKFSSQFKASEVANFDRTAPIKHPGYMIRNSAFEEVLRLEFYPPPLSTIDRIKRKISSVFNKLTN